MKKRFITILIIIAAGAAIFFFNNRRPKFQMLNYSIDEVLKNFTHESVGGIHHLDKNDFQIPLSGIKELEKMTFQKEKLPQDASEIMTFNDNGVYIHILKADQDYYLATNSFKVSNDGGLNVPLIEGYEHIYTSASLADWVEDLPALN